MTITHRTARVVRRWFVERRIRNPTIARGRYYRGQDGFQSGPRINDQIRKSPVRLIDQDDNQIGVVDLDEAKRMAREAGLDLVEVAADSRPPVCRIIDYGKFKYEQAKKDKANKAKSKTSELKEVRMGRSMKIDPHDIAIRMKKARQFLMEGHKVQIVQNFRGREVTMSDRGRDRMRDIADQLSDIAKLEMPPRQMGRRMTMLLTPDRTKIEQVKAKLERERKAAEAAGQPLPEPEENIELPDDEDEDDDFEDDADEVMDDESVNAN